MLGWFKKKFGKQQTEAVETAAPEQGIQPPVEEEIVVAGPEAAAAPEPAPPALADEVTPVEPAAGEEPVPVAELPVAEAEEPASASLEPPIAASAEASILESEEPPEEANKSAAVEPPAPEPIEAEQAIELPTVSEEAQEEETGPLPDAAEIATITVAEAVAETPAETPAETVAETEAVTEAETTDEAEIPSVGEALPPEPDRAEAEPALGLSVESNVEPEAEPAAMPTGGRTQEKPAAKSLFQRLQERLGKTRDALAYRLDRLFLGKKEIDQDLFDQLEEILITADLGVATTMELLEAARKRIKRDQLSDPQALKAIIRDQIFAYIEASEQPAELVMPEEGPFVIMVVGVNGVGKTTTIGKLAAKFVRAGQSVLLVAGDTFRAAAINQLKIWGERVGVEVVAQHPGADPSSVVFDGLTHGVAHGHEVIIIDTAGRLHTSVNLMEELKKIKRVIGKKMPGAPHEIMLVLDATTGQNGISQAKLFHQAVGISGLTLTKLDGTAKGGIVANVCRELKIPVRFIGIGEQIDDLRDFDANEFVEALFASQAD
ncbi:MAG: signal recognition particle-docking protein FtsY [Desulfobulbus sp.]|jgi:fused signal recognition particle receptor|uniref:signal recognition particle-docking protein FtsY n=1 Tax=Desulfobulbus sp. TaxID=895 RepID=UPI00283CB6E2|nr:signal recognition particle-docking protein FtsY [Desulfobulbus sp.]MDR2550302.1 signal recognition particle-docking protein FtsY [Desulfobulbus sp.]